MSVLVVNRREVRELLPMRECIELMAHALAALARGDAVVPLRPVIRLPDGVSAFAAMPAYVGTPAAIGVKLISVFPGNEGRGVESHQGATLLFDAADGALRAIIDAGAITAIRTAAVSGVATRLLARQDAHTLALLGSGVQAATHLDAVCAVRAIQEVRVWSRTPAHARRFAEESSRRTGLAIGVAERARDAVRGADVVCTVTASREPVLEGAWLMPGAHVNAVGASLPSARELDTEAVRRSRLFVDSRASALHESGDFLLARAEGAIDDAHIVGELGELVLGRVDGRPSDDEITVFESLGLAVEDVMAAHAIHQRALDRGVGTRVEL